MSKKQQENLERLKQAIDTLESVASNPTTPRNIRNAVKEIVKSLNDESLSPAVRAANAISILDDLTQDPNMSSHIRVILWQAVSTLEGIRE
ncbi:MAG: hypothetical protein KatS3mg003_1358 [Candidatus Nitrosocaldaceae archaeon]|nr:MAG: hypothetical protein KatS3mg003_1358 [Candidatus Nitrosocaldaceae archaeon]